MNRAHISSEARDNASENGGVPARACTRLESFDQLRGPSLAVLAKACSIRLDDADVEERRIVLLAGALGVAREASDAMHTWLIQLLSEYRGSRTAWDLELTSQRLELALARFDETVRETAAKLRARIPAIVDREE